VSIDVVFDPHNRNRLARKLNILAYLVAENLALRQQLIVLKRNQSPDLERTGQMVLESFIQYFKNQT